MLVTLSMNRCVATSVSFMVMSRPTETRCSPSRLNSVSSTQSEWVPIWRSCLPVKASMARTVLSAQPKASTVPSGDQLTPYTVSNVTGAESLSSFFSTSQTWTSPNRPGSPAAAARDLPSGEKASDCTRSDMPTSRAGWPGLSASCSRISW